MIKVKSREHAIVFVVLLYAGVIAVCVKYVCMEFARHREVDEQIAALEVKIAEYKGLKCEWPTDYQYVPWEQVREMEEP